MAARDLQDMDGPSEVSVPEFQICLVGNGLKENEALMKAIQHYQFKIVYSETGQEFVGSGGEYRTIFVLPEFEGDAYTELHRSGQRIFGPTAIIQLCERNEHLPSNVRPLYNLSMRNLVLCFTGFRVKEELSRMVNIIHHMGGSIRKDFNVKKITHLIGSSTHSEKYRYAATWGIPIMQIEWINQLWTRRHDSHCYATDEDLMVFKLRPFVGCKMTFIGFQQDEKSHMETVAIENGATVVRVDNVECTHYVMEEGVSFPQTYSEGIYVVRSEWFWASIQMDARADERIYALELATKPVSTPPVPPTFVATSKGSKRKRLEDVAHQLAMGAQESEFYSAPPQWIRKKGEVARLSISGSYLDATLSPEKSCLDTTPEISINDSIIKSPYDMRTLSARQQVCMELFQTETNYVRILHTIITIFKEPLERPDQVGGPLLVAAEVKIIFGNLPPIYEVHQKLRAELAEIMHNWKDDCSIGDLILSHAEEILRAYPPFINFFEKTKQVLANCDSTKPRFHAFLKRCQSKPECGRQSLQELLIRPVQRLPSVILLLTDIQKRTNKSDSDYSALEKAINKIKDVLTHINEDKRKTEGQLAMFDIVNDIENCPANLLSSHRSFILKVDVQEITDLLGKKNDTITMFLFSDVLEFCKKRRRADTMLLKSPSLASLTTATLRTHHKCFKHLELIPLSHIKRVVDIVETDEWKNVFAIVIRSNQEIKERLYTFMLHGEEVDKGTVLRSLCRHVANSVCRADAENLLTCLEPQQLSLQTSDGTTSTLAKAFKIATKTRDKLGRALSMRRTPLRRELSRTISTFISPLRNLGSPSTSLNTLRLASVTNLTELEPNQPGTLLCSPIAEKKLKSSSCGVSTSKFL